MENKEEDKPKRGRPAKEKAKLDYSINLKLTEEDFKAVKEVGNESNSVRP